MERSQVRCSSFVQGVVGSGVHGMGLEYFGLSPNSFHELAMSRIIADKCFPIRRVPEWTEFACRRDVGRHRSLP